MTCKTDVSDLEHLLSLNLESLVTAMMNMPQTERIELLRDMKALYPEVTEVVDSLITIDTTLYCPNGGSNRGVD